MKVTIESYSKFYSYGASQVFRKPGSLTMEAKPNEE